MSVQRRLAVLLMSGCTVISVFLFYTAVVTTNSHRQITLAHKLYSKADSNPNKGLSGLKRRYLYHDGVVIFHPTLANVVSPSRSGRTYTEASTLSDPTPAAAPVSTTTSGPPSSAFMALRPYGDWSKFYFPPETVWGHPFLRQRTYPITPRVDRCNNCFRYNYTTLLPSSVCEDKPTVDLLVIVTTVPWKRWVRKAIRETWGNFSQTIQGWTVAGPLFLFGTGHEPRDQATIVAEHEEFGDVLQDDYIDSYFNLSLKVLSGYNWFANNCSQAKYILRTAEDNYINIPNTLSYIKTQDANIRTRMVGSCYPSAGVIRLPRNKWYVTPTEYPYRRYPAYCVGTAVLTSASLTQQLLQTSANVPYFVLEDIYFGLVLKELSTGDMGSNVLHHGGFNIQGPVVTRYDKVCSISRLFWCSVHEVNVDEMRRIFEHCQQNKDWFEEMRDT